MTQPAPATVTPPVETSTPAQRRLDTFCSPSGAEVFHSIVYHQQIWTPDPFDVETIHAEAREVFQRLLNRAATQPPPTSGRILLLLGDSGSGKTHLMRAFRNYVHADERGYCGYLQMTSLTSNYARYVLSNFIDALDQPYHAPEVTTSGLMRLSLGLLENVPDLSAEDRAVFQDGYVQDLAERVNIYADWILADVRFASVDLDLIRALLYLQRDDPRIKSRVLRWLRCEDLAPNDRAVLGSIVPRHQEEDPLRMLTFLGQLMNVVNGMPLVLCVDQLEDTYDHEKTGGQFRRAIDTLVALADAVPSALVVIACLDDYFTVQKQHLMRSKLDRLERDPEPLRLTGQRTAEEIESIVARRLQSLYDENDVPVDAEMPTFPFTAEQLAPLANLRTRDVLDFCRRHREKCLRAGDWVPPAGAPHLPPEPPPPSLDIEQAWNDFHAAYKASVPDDETALGELLAWAIKQSSEEMPAGYWFSPECQGRMVPVEMHGPENIVDRLLVAVCDRGPQGGGLGRQISQVEKLADRIPAVIVRSTAFPISPTAAVSKQIAEVVRRGGRRVVVEDSDWRKMLAFRAFSLRDENQPAFAPWLRQCRPLSQLASLRSILALDNLLKQRPTATATPNSLPITPTGDASRTPPLPTPPPVPLAANSATGPLFLGTKGGLTPTAVTVIPNELTQHAAFLGGSGSGKTTAALNLIEQLLERGVPAVLLDRKGDLCRYADPLAWQASLPDPQQTTRRSRLREQLDIALFTPGQPTGRPLIIPVVPEGMDQLPTLEREQLAGYAAAALGGMIGYKPKGPDQSRLAILRKAIEVLGSVAGRAITLPDVRQLVETKDDALLNAVGGFDDRLYKKLNEELLTLWHQHKNLLAGDGERLDIDALLGRGDHAKAGKTRLSIISTRFLGDTPTVDFWVAQLLTALSRWIGRRPAGALQAVFLFDEADQYLPAMRQPATKAPMENLLKRARSAGVGLMLATQSPGDFDYKCRDNIRTWLVGRVKEQTALNKLKPMFADCRVDVAVRLPTQGTGQFHLLREKEVAGIQTTPSLITTEQLPEERILELARLTWGQRM